MKLLFAVLRVLVAAAIVAAVVGQLRLSISKWQEAGLSDTTVQTVNFFSFFTIEANIASALVLLIGAALHLRSRTGRPRSSARRVVDPHWYLVLRAAVVAYMATTGIVYNLLLRGVELPQGLTLPWSNEVLHVVAPVYLVLDWLLAPGRSPVRYRAVWGMVVFPIVWAVYTLVRGPLVTDDYLGRDYWYPYPFLNPVNSPNGYLSVSFYIVLIAVIIAVVALGVVWVSRRGSRSTGRR